MDDIQGAFGSIGAMEPEGGVDWKRRVLTFPAIVGPGLIVMVGDNDAGAFGTYTQARQTYGASLLWTFVSSSAEPTELDLVVDHLSRSPDVVSATWTVSTTS